MCHSHDSVLTLATRTKTNKLHVLKWRGGKSIDERSRKIAKYLCESAQNGWCINIMPNIRVCPVYLLFVGRDEPDEKKETLVCFSEELRESTKKIKKRPKQNAISLALRESVILAESEVGKNEKDVAVTNTELEGEKKLRKEISDNASESQHVVDDVELESGAGKDEKDLIITDTDPFEQREENVDMKKEMSDGVDTVAVKRDEGEKKKKKKFCQNCGIEREKGLLKCKSCKQVRYCGSVCQRVDWFNEHSMVCGL